MLELELDGEYRAMSCSSDGAVLYVAHQHTKGGAVSLFDLTEPDRPFKPRLLHTFAIDQPRQLTLARAPGEVSTS